MFISKGGVLYLADDIVDLARIDQRFQGHVCVTRAGLGKGTAGLGNGLAICLHAKRMLRLSGPKSSPATKLAFEYSFRCMLSDECFQIYVSSDFMLPKFELLGILHTDRIVNLRCHLES
jgi:hypothetical protein